MRFKRFFVLHKFVLLALAFSFFVLVVMGQEFKQTALSEKKFTANEKDAGFVDQSHLTKHFKRVVGITPRRHSPDRNNIMTNLTEEK